MFNCSIAEYEEYLNGVVKVENEDGFGTYLAKNHKDVLHTMWCNLVQFTPSIKKHFALKSMDNVTKSQESIALKEYLSKYGEINFLIDKGEDIEIVTNVNNPSGIFKARSDDYEIPKTIEELPRAHHKNLKKVISERPEKQCLVRVMPEITIDNEFNVGMYTRLMFI
jgi:hypothetical protein